MMEIELTRGKVAIVDDDDYEVLSKSKWMATYNGKVWYARRSHRGIYMHRVIMGVSSRSVVCDHRDGDGLNNQKNNLRISDKSQNAINRHTPKKDNCSSRFYGVSFMKRVQRWRAYIVKDYRQTSLGLYDNQIDAAKAYNVAAKELHGEFAKVNVI